MMEKVMKSLIVCVFACLSVVGCRVVYDEPVPNNNVGYVPCATDANCDSGLICAYSADHNEMICLSGCRNDAACGDPSKICEYDKDLGRDICQVGCRGDATCASKELCSNDSDLGYSICVSGCYVTETTANETTSTADEYGNVSTVTRTTVTVTYDSCKRNGEALRCDTSLDTYECISTVATDGGVALDGGMTPADGGYNPPADGGAITNDGGNEPPAADGGANPDGGSVPPAADGGAVTNDGGSEPPAADGGAVADGGAETLDAGYTPDAGVVLDGGNAQPDGGVTPIDGGTTPDGGVTVDGGVYTPTTSITAHICCPTGKEVILWWGNADANHSPNSNGANCGDFTMALAGDNNFCSRGTHPNTSATTLEGGWFSYNCRSGSDYGGWEQSTVTTVVNQAGSPMNYSAPFRATTSASNIAEVVVGNTCY